MQIYFIKNGFRFGPLEEEKVARLLKNGQLSPTSLGIKVGENQWQALGKLFPSITFDLFSTEPQPYNSSKDQMKQGGGFRRVTGTIFLIFGLLAFFSGVGSAGTNFYLNKVNPPNSCQVVMESEKIARQSLQEYQAAKGTPTEAEKGHKAKEAIDKIGKESESCSTAMAYQRGWFLTFLGIGIIGLIGSIAGLFIRKV